MKFVKFLKRNISKYSKRENKREAGLVRQIRKFIRKMKVQGIMFSFVTIIHYDYQQQKIITVEYLYEYSRRI